jgi:hypothetical protein
MMVLGRNALLAVTIFGVGAGACAERSVERFELEGSTYSIPSHHLSSSNREAYTFLRIKPPEKPYELVYDSRAPGAAQGPGVPRLFSVNDEEQSGVEYRQVGKTTIVCRKAVNPKGGCGLRMRHLGVDWALLLPMARVEEAASLERDAAALLDGYAI